MNRVVRNLLDRLASRDRCSRDEPRSDGMNTEILQGKWHQLKGSVKAQWGKLTDDELDQVDGNAEKLVGLVQERYGYAKQRAQEEVDSFLARQKAM
jgi:uncharacterized protein YjbJ (UPF0337 family)